MGLIVSLVRPHGGPALDDGPSLSDLPAAKARIRRRVGDRIDVEIAWDAVGRLGPTIEAEARRIGWTLEIPALRDRGAALRDESRKWELIQRGATESSDAMFAAGMGTFDPFLYIEGAAVSRSSLDVVPERAEQLLDRVDWHLASADGDHTRAFMHIGTILKWLAIHDFIDESAIDGNLLRQLKSGGFDMDELEDGVDGKLLTSYLVGDGRAFALSYCGGDKSDYIEDWEETFGSAAVNYAVTDVDEAYRTMAPVIDARYGAWRRGRVSGAT